MWWDGRAGRANVSRQAGAQPAWGAPRDGESWKADKKETGLGCLDSGSVHQRVPVTFVPVRDKSKGVPATLTLSLHLRRRVPHTLRHRPKEADITGKR